MLSEYLQYYRENDAACVGLSRIGGYGNRWTTCHADGKSRDTGIFWNYIPDRFISWNSGGICLIWNRNKRNNSVTFDKLRNKL